MVNLLAMSTVLRTPMILARTGNNEVTLGIVSSIAALGGAAGGLAMSLFGEPRRRIHGVFGGLILVNIGRAVMGVGQDVYVWSMTGFAAATESDRYGAKQIIQAHSETLRR